MSWLSSDGNFRRLGTVNCHGIAPHWLKVQVTSISLPKLDEDQKKNYCTYTKKIAAPVNMDDYSSTQSKKVKDEQNIEMILKTIVDYL